MKIIMAVLLSAALASCSTSEPMYAGYKSEQALDKEAPYCHNGYCMYELAMAYSRIGAAKKAWAYIDLSARQGNQDARAALINAGKHVPPKDPE